MRVPPPCLHAPPFLGGVAGAEAGGDLSSFLRVNPAFASQKFPFGTAGLCSAAPPHVLDCTGRGGGAPVATGGGGGGFDGIGGSKLSPEDLLPRLVSVCSRTSADQTKKLEDGESRG